MSEFFQRMIGSFGIVIEFLPRYGLKKDVHNFKKLFMDVLGKIAVVICSGLSHCKLQVTHAALFE